MPTEDENAKLTSRVQEGLNRRLFSKPQPGFAWNPLTSLPRNSKCPCLSGQKFKKCCLDKLPRVVPVNDAKHYKEQMTKPDLVFVTKKNEEFMKQVAQLPNET